jgi:uncharacterized protein with von Willebrand factor type A (vWA) domain
MSGGEVVIRRVEGLVSDLRATSVPIGVAELTDAMAAITHVDLSRRNEVRLALVSTLVKRASDYSVFDILFDVWFPAGVARPSGVPLRDRLVQALANDDDTQLVQLAREAAAEGPARYQRAVRELGASTLVSDALRNSRATGMASTPARLTAAVDRFLRALRKEILARQHVEAANCDAAALVRPENVEIAAASAVELEELRSAVRPLARRLAAKLHSAQRDRRGTLDMRRTIRRSLSAGGVPHDPVWRRRRPQRPDLWLICDVSGSVAEFARFTVGLVSAVHDVVSSLHAFVFVDDIVELTDTLADRSHDIDAFALVGAAAVGLTGRRSDWGRALHAFEERHANCIGRRSTIVILGDGRSHGADPGADVIERLCHKARRVTLLVPEQHDQWGTTDSALLDYADAGAVLREVRNLSQLSEAIGELATR